MTDISGISDPNYVTGQYHSAANINSRIRLHERFSVNPYGWHRWVFDRLHLPEHCSILELGCGTGQLWAANLDRIPPGWKICLSDFSTGMLAQARVNLGETATRFEFRQVDAQAIPFASGSYDTLIANHMLYHLPDREKALAEIRRVLAGAGCLVASTVGSRHLLELRDILVRFSPALREWGVIPDDSFTLEDGADQLATMFPHVHLDRYHDALRVTEIDPLIEYVCSGRVKFTPRERNRFTRFMKWEFERQGGELRITKDSGLFTAYFDNTNREKHVQ